MAEWTLQIPGAEPKAETKSSSSSSSSSRDQQPEPEPELEQAQLPGPVSATKSVVTPQVKTLAQYEQSEFTVSLFDEKGLKVTQSNVVVCTSSQSLFDVLFMGIRLSLPIVKIMITP